MANSSTMKGGACAALPASQNWTTIICGALCVMCAFAVLIVALPETFLLHRLVDDRLNYFVLARNIAHLGSSEISLSENGPEIIYSSGMAYLYAPLFRIFLSFEHQLRGIQVLNCLMLGAVFLLTTTYVLEKLPQLRATPIAIIMGAAMVLDSHWQLTLLMPNADVVPALINAIAFTYMQRRCYVDPRFSVASGFGHHAVLFLMGGLGSLVKISLAALPVSFGLMVSLERKRQALTTALVLLVGLTIILAVNWGVAVHYFDTMVKAYVFPTGEVSFAAFANSLRIWIANLVFSAIPDRIIPNFRHLMVYGVGDHGNTFQPNNYSLPVILAMSVGLAITAIVTFGFVRLWRRSRIELTYMLICLPVFMVVTNSTSRYLMAFQPVIWVCFFSGLPRMKTGGTGALGLAVAVASLLFVATQGRSIWIRNRGDVQTISYIRDTSQVYAQVFDQLRSLRPETTRLIEFKTSEHTSAMWRAATDIPLRTPDAELPGVTSRYDTLVVLTCSKRACRLFENARQEVFQKILNTGKFEFALRYATSAPTARAEIYSVRPAGSDVLP